MEHLYFLFFFTFLLFSCGSVHSCGGITHIEISYRALNRFQDAKHNTSYDTIIRQNPSALEAGSSYPDAFYSSICFFGRYHNVSEDTHWTPFIKAAVKYIHDYYPKPWNVRTQMLIAFLMGSVSHAVADISWHSLGIPQGFISAMAKTNYHNIYTEAHSAADLGGDVLNLFQLNLNYSHTVGEWYVPTLDLESIYNEYYGENRINSSVIETCTKLLYLAKVGEKLAVKKYFPISANASPFLVDELYEYFLGGIEDMTVWTQRIWKQVIDILEDSKTQCDLPHNPLFIRCGKWRSSKKDASSDIKSISAKGLLYREPDLKDLTLDMIEVERGEGGVWFRPGPKLKEKLSALNSHHNSLHFETERQKKISQKKAVTDNSLKDTPSYPSAVFSVPSEYAKLGRAYAVADLDKDGNEDVIVGAPGYYSSSGQQNGMVFILYGTDYGLNVSNLDMYHAADVRIPGPENDHGAHSQFGASLAVFDFDKDGKLDIAIGAPSYGSENLTYQGQVYIFSVIERKKFSFRGEVICEDLYCNLGATLATGDIDLDGFHDLLVASPYAPGGGEQRGFVGAISANSGYQGKQKLKFVLSVKDEVMRGSQNYSWLGKSLAVKTFADHTTYVAVGEPNFRKCTGTNCTYNTLDVQAIGQVHLMKVVGEKLIPYRQIKGHDIFEMMGSAVAMGRPYDEFTDILAVTASGTNVPARVQFNPTEFAQVGAVYLYNITNYYQFPIAVFNGDRRFGRFGSQLKFADLNRDGYDDLIIGAPLRTKDFTEELHGAQQGRVYVYLGGRSFPRGDVNNKCGIRHIIEPCPGEKASYDLALDEQKARFGSQIAVVHTKKKVNLLVTAEHSSIGGRLSGAIAVYDF